MTVACGTCKEKRSCEAGATSSTPDGMGYVQPQLQVLSSMWSRRLDGPMYRVIYVHDQLLLSHLNSTSRFDTAGNHDWFRFTCHHYATGLFRNVLHSLPTCCRLEASSTTTRGCPDVRACVCVCEHLRNGKKTGQTDARVSATTFLLRSVGQRRHL